MQNQTLSANKIIVLVAFLSTAMVASLFVFHMRNNMPAALSSDEGLIFPAPRDIKSFTLVNANDQPFTQTDLYHHWTLLFFGFTHCTSICPTTLGTLSRVYNKLHTTYPDLQVAFISLDPERDAPDSLLNYVHSFHPHFIGASGELQELRKLQSQLGVYSARTRSSSNYQLQHTASIFLINPKGQWVGLFHFGMNPEQFTNAFNKSIKQLNKYS